MLDKVKNSLRIKSNSLDDELEDYINAALRSLSIAGVTIINESDPLIIQAVKVYCKANMSTDTITSERYNRSFEMLKQSLSLCSEYNIENI